VTKARDVNVVVRVLLVGMDNGICFHNSAGHDGSLDQIASDLSVARDKMLINLPKIHSAIWRTQMA
jgi:hypothetical protein